MRIPSLVVATFLLVSVCYQSKAELVRTVFSTLTPQSPVVLEEGKHKVAEDVDGYTQITETENGFLFEIRSFDKLDRVPLTIGWDSDSDEPMWNLVRIERMELDGEDYLEDPTDVIDFYLQSAIRFDPWIRPGQNAFEYAPFDFAAFPADNIFGTSLGLTPCRDCPSTGEPFHDIVFEMSVIEMQPPLPADFNYDQKVDFADFLVLSDFFGARASDTMANSPIHFYGDANLDLVTDFDDFLILRESFDTSREVQAASRAVPEPSSGVLFAIALVSVVRPPRRQTL